MEEGDEWCPMNRMGVSGWVFLLVPSYPGCPGPKGVKQLCMWFGVWLNYFQCQMSSSVCVPTWTCISAIALMLFPFVCCIVLCTGTHTRTLLTALCPGLPVWAGTRKVTTNLDFAGARDSEWQWHQPGHMLACTLLQTDNRASISPLKCFSCCPTNSIKALNVTSVYRNLRRIWLWTLLLRTFKCFIFIHFFLFILLTLTVVWNMFLVFCKYYLCLLVYRSGE